MKVFVMASHRGRIGYPNGSDVVELAGLHHGPLALMGGTKSAQYSLVVVEAAPDRRTAVELDP